MRKFLLWVVVGLTILSATPTQATELLMFSNPRCSYCQAFLEEVKPTYAESPAGEVMPLTVIDMDKPVPDWYIQAFKEKRIGRIAHTPTFIVWTDREVKRWEGYKGVNNFYNLIGEFMKKNQHLFGGEAFLGKENEKQWGEDGPRPGRGHEGSHSKHLELKRAVPDGVIDSKDIFDHTYDTPQKALAAAVYLDCGTNVHYHAKENVWMPCSMAISSGTDSLMKEGS